MANIKLQPNTKNRKTKVRKTCVHLVRNAKVDSESKLFSTCFKIHRCIYDTGSLGLLVNRIFMLSSEENVV